GAWGGGGGGGGEGGGRRGCRLLFEQNFLFRVRVSNGAASGYMVVTIFDAGRGGMPVSVGTLLGHCRVPLFRTPRRREHTMWHKLIEADGSGVVGMLKATIRNLGAGLIPRPAHNASLPLASGPVEAQSTGVVVPPLDLPNKEESATEGTGRGTGEGAGARVELGSAGVDPGPINVVTMGGQSEGLEVAGDGGASRNILGEHQKQKEHELLTVEELPDHPRLDSFYIEGSVMHRRLFFRVGSNQGDVVPANELVLEVFPKVRIPLHAEALTGLGGGGGSPALPPGGG
ncbi:unnamed protein product, partial [Choristocarpus tenellus]